MVSNLIQHLIFCFFKIEFFFHIVTVTVIRYTVNMTMRLKTIRKLYTGRILEQVLEIREKEIKERRRASFRKYREKNRQKCIERSRQWRKDNRERMLEYRNQERVKQQLRESSTRYRKNNPEKARTASKSWAKRNPEVVKEIQKRYYQKHKERIRARAKEKRKLAKQEKAKAKWKKLQSLKVSL